MSVSRPFAVSVGLATGLVAAVGFYTAASGADAPRQVTTAKPQAVPAAAVVTPEPVVSFAPCASPARLEHGACVTHKVVTKVVAAPARPAAASATPVAASSPAASRRTAATPRSTPAAVEHENADHEDATEVEHEDADDEGTEVGEQGEDHGDSDPGDDAGDPEDD